MKSFAKHTKNIPAEAAVFLSWIFPTAGLFLKKKTRKAMMYSGLILVSFLIGVLCQGRFYVPTRGEFLSYLGFLGDVGSGILYGIFLLFGYRGNLHAVTSDYGSIYILASGLMNWLLLLEVYDLWKGKDGSA